MVFVLTLPIKASHLLAPLTGARHHVLEGAEPLAREERSSKRTPRWRRDEGEGVRGAEKKEEDEEEVGGDNLATLITATVDQLVLQGVLKNIKINLKSEQCQVPGGNNSRTLQCSHNIDKATTGYKV